jgi:thiol-disulfide isomerase/thioredoxin
MIKQTDLCHGFLGVTYYIISFFVNLEWCSFCQWTCLVLIGVGKLKKINYIVDCLSMFVVSPSWGILFIMIKQTDLCHGFLGVMYYIISFFVNLEWCSFCRWTCLVLISVGKLKKNYYIVDCLQGVKLYIVVTL